MASIETAALHENEPHANDLAHRLNWLRAGVLGANDGIVSVAAIVVGVAGATTSTGAILTAGAAGLVGGAVSMALGEYVSVSSQSDSQKALIEKERRELAEQPEEELAELTAIYESKGLRPETARKVAAELTEHDALAAHLSAELNIDEDDIVSPWHAAFASAIAFTLGAVLPMLAILLPPPGAARTADLHFRAARARNHRSHRSMDRRQLEDPRRRARRHRRGPCACRDVPHRKPPGLLRSGLIRSRTGLGRLTVMTTFVSIPGDLQARYSRTAEGRAWLSGLPGLINASLERWQLSVDLEPGAEPWNGHGGIVIPVRYNGSPFGAQDSVPARGGSR